MIRKGREIGYILIDDLDKCLADFNETDKQYVIETLDGMEIQLIQTIDEYDEYKYLSGEEAIKILQSLSDGDHEAFVKPLNKDEDLPHDLKSFDSSKNFLLLVVIIPPSPVVMCLVASKLKLVISNKDAIGKPLYSAKGACAASLITFTPYFFEIFLI